MFVHGSFELLFGPAFLGKTSNSSCFVAARKETSIYSYFTLKYVATATSTPFPIHHSHQSSF